MDTICMMQETQAPMAQDFGVAMRDPVFYRWHTFLNDIYLNHKHSLPSYKADQVSQSRQIKKCIPNKRKLYNFLYKNWQIGKFPAETICLCAGKSPYWQTTRAKFLNVKRSKYKKNYFIFHKNVFWNNGQKEIWIYCV